MGKLLTRSLRLACTTAADALVNYSAMFTDVYVLQRSEISHCPDGEMLVDMSISILIFDDGCCLDLSVSSTCHLRLKIKSSHRPDGKIADGLASILDSRLHICG